MPTRHRGTAKERTALDAYIKLLRAANAIHARATRHLGEAGLTPSQFGVLEALHHVGPMCLTDLAAKILRTAGNLTMVVDNLEKRGLARRVVAGADRRFVTVKITSRGRALMRAVFPEHVRSIERLMSRLTPEEQGNLAGLCRKLGVGDSD